MTDLKELRDLHNARSRFYDPLTASSFEVACIEALPAILDVAEAADKWWKMHKPIRWTRHKHLATPDINCVGEVERALAVAAARLTEGKP